MRAYIIDAEHQTIRETELFEDGRLKQMQTIVGGCIALAHRWEETGDDLFVNDEGLFDEDPYFFFVRGAHQPFAGNAVVFGYDGQGNGRGADIDIETLRKSVFFLGRGSDGPQERLLVLCREG